MALKVAFSLLALTVAVYGQIARLAPSAIPQLVPRFAEEEFGPAQYRFQYDINTPETADIKSQQEERNGNTLQGSYSFIQPDGLRRIVEYSDAGDGFVALVRYEDSGINIPAPAFARIPVASGPRVATPFAPRFAARLL